MILSAIEADTFGTAVLSRDDIGGEPDIRIQRQPDTVWRFGWHVTQRYQSFGKCLLIADALLKHLEYFARRSNVDAPFVTIDHHLAAIQMPGRQGGKANDGGNAEGARQYGGVR